MNPIKQYNLIIYHIMTIFGKLSKKQDRTLNSAAYKWCGSTLTKRSKKDLPIITEELLKQNKIFLDRINYYGKDEVKVEGA